MKKWVFMLCLLLVPFASQAAQVKVKYQKGLACYANEMKSSLEQMNKNFNETLELEVFCSYGKVKFTSISRSTGGGLSKYVPDYMYTKCPTNPCK